MDALPVPDDHTVPSTPNITRSTSIMTEKQRKALKKSQKKKKKKLKSIGKRHPEFELTYDMMLGIRYAVSLSERSVTTTRTTTAQTVPTIPTIRSSATSISSDDELSLSSSSDASDDDFMETKKYRFPSSGSDTTPTHQMSDFKFKDFVPQVFRQLREWF